MADRDGRDRASRERWARIRDELREEKAGKQTGEEHETKKLRTLISRAEPMIEQIMGHYRQYIAGAEEISPTGRRKTLEEIMTQLQYLPKATVALKFKYDALLNRYTTFRDKWDKIDRDLETGKIERRRSPHRKKMRN